MATEPKFSKGDRIELTEKIGFARAGAKGVVIEVFDDDMVMVETKGGFLAPVRRQTSMVEASQLRLRR